MPTPVVAPRLSPAEGYRLWANHYDREPNPMLSLERRILEPLLPPLAGLDILDIGCGTGRWLQALQDSGARSLLGVDFSAEMLRHAHAKLGASVEIVQADCTNLDLPPASADLILCNFVLSYLPDISSFLKAARKALRHGGSLFVTDLHPETVTALHWRRGASAQTELREIETHAHAIAEVTAACNASGLRVVVFLEPRFGAQERIIFERNAKSTYFDQVHSLPPIYILQVDVPELPRRFLRTPSQTSLVLTGARFALGPTDAQQGELRIANQRVDALSSTASAVHAASSPGASSDLTGYLVLPGLINAHDHLEFALFPRLGKGAYNNFLQWVDDIYRPDASPIAELRRIPRDVRLWWGAIRNLLSGVTTVCHHNPYEPDLFTHDFGVRVLRNFGWAHSLRLDSEFAQKKAATPDRQPFFLHLAEGIDDTSSHEIYALHRAGVLDSNTVVIHGLGMDGNGRALFRASQAGLVWCPSSNLFLFGKTFSAAELRKFTRVALGSDSPLTATGDLLDEINCAHRLLRASPTDLYSYVTQQPANIMRLESGEGHIRVGAIADLIAVRDTGRCPAETLVNLTYRDIELVVFAGRVQLASPDMKYRFPADLCNDLEPLSIEGTTRWIRAPLQRLFTETVPHLGSQIRLGGKQVFLAN